LTNREITDKKQMVEYRPGKRDVLSGIIIAAVFGGFLGFLSPFGMDQLPLQYSIGFWVVTCLCGYFIYGPLLFFGELILLNRLSVWWMRVVISIFLASLLMSFVVPIVSWIFFAGDIHFGEQFVNVFPQTLVIGGVLTAISMIQRYIKQQNVELYNHKKQDEAHKRQVLHTNNQQVEKFMELLPIEKRGRLLCLEMSDHYVKVFTDKGHALLLMRFKDAIESLSEYPGLQTHRSWWVAKDAISSVNKDGRKQVLNLSNGLQVPVSRTYTERLKSANIY
jgi:hypothetical protein